MTYAPNYPPGYDGPPDPHNSIAPIKPARKQWKCNDCGAVGTANALLGKAGCTKQHEPCTSCGHSPVCALDCSGMAALLAGGFVTLPLDPPPGKGQ